MKMKNCLVITIKFQAQDAACKTFMAQYVSTRNFSGTHINDYYPGRRKSGSMIAVLNGKCIVKLTHEAFCGEKPSDYVCAFQTKHPPV